MTEFLSGLFGVIIATYIAWYTWLKKLRGQTERDLLNDALGIQAAKEAWILESSQNNLSIVSALEKTPTYKENDQGLPWLRKVEIRAVLDDSMWNYPTKELPCYDFIEGRRAWIIRDKVEDKSIANSKILNKQALISSRGIEELCGWVEKVASANQGCKWFNQVLTDNGLRMLNPLLAAISRPDRIKALDERLTKRGKILLRQYRVDSLKKHIQQLAEQRKARQGSSNP